MKRAIKIAGIGIGIVICLFLIVLATVYLRVETKRQATIAVDVPTFEMPTDAASIEEGKRLVQVRACADCHGTDLAGKTFINEPPIGVISGSNLTPGQGSRVKNYQDADWVRAIRYAIDPDGHPLLFMPAGDFHGMSNEELGRIIAYLKTLAPIDRENVPQTIGPVARVLYNLGQMPLLFPYEEVDLKAQPVQSVEVASTVEYGRYLSMACTGCHGPGFAGGHVPGTPPDWPDAKNLTPSGRFATWSYADFKKVLTEGLTPDGHQINAQFMPWKSMQAMKEVEIEALYKFLRQIPAKAEGTR